MRWLRRVGRRLFPGSLILLYHRVAETKTDPWALCVTPEHFAEHLQVLLNQRRAVPLERLAATDRAESAVRRSVALTFDDGYADNLHAAKPLLEQYDVPATVFVVTGDLGDTREFWWDELERLVLQPGTLPDVLQLQVDGVHRRWELGSIAHLSVADHDRWRNWRADGDANPSPRHALYVSLYHLLYGTEHAKRQDLLAELRSWAKMEPHGRYPRRPRGRGGSLPGGASEASR